MTKIREQPMFPFLSAAHAEAIGFVAAYWSLVEDHMAWMIRYLIANQHDAGYIVTAELSSLQKISTLTALVAAVRNQALFDLWIIIEGIAEKLRNERNEAVHSLWILHDGLHHAYRVKARGQLSLSLKPVSTDELKILQSRILDLSDMLSKFSVALEGTRANQILKSAPQGLPISRPQGQKALAQARSREEKKVKKEAQRRHARATRPLNE